ncbi:MAG: radical SAM/SPASM domain-containing protein [Sumerlaeia bacterium]
MSLLEDQPATNVRFVSDEVLVRDNPTHIWIEPTNRCNTRCKHCGHFYDVFGRDMDIELYEKIKAAVLDDVERIELIGYGEPLMAKNFERMFDDCLERGIRIYTTSNGILLRKDDLVAKLVRSDVYLCLSIDGARQETFEHIRPYVRWHKMLETLECIKRNADAAGPETKFRFRFNYVAMRHSIGDLPDLVRLAHKYGAGEVFVLPLGGEEQFAEVNGESLRDAPELVSPAFLEALELAAEYDIHLTVPESFRPLILEGAERGQGLRGKAAKAARRARLASLYVKRNGFSAAWQRIVKKPTAGVRAKAGVTYCNMPWKDSYFASDGKIYPCCIMNETLGDMKTQSWEEIWNGAAYRNLRRTVHSWNPTAVCRFCPLPTGINGGDDKQYARYFSRFRAEPVELDADGVAFGGGFHGLERHEDGSASHVWMGKTGTMTVPARRGAKFLRLTIITRSPGPDLNAGIANVNGGEDEPFDNSCEHLHFPVEGIAGGKIELALEMERTHHVEGDCRELALVIRGVDYLF